MGTVRLPLVEFFGGAVQEASESARTPPLHSNRQTSFLQALRFHSYRNAALHGGTRLTAAIRWGAFIEAMHGRHKRGPCCTLRL